MRRRWIRLLRGAAAAAALLPCSTRALEPTPPRDLTSRATPEEVGFDAARIEALDQAMAGLAGSGRVAGLTMLLARHGRIVELKAYGEADLASRRAMTDDAIFRIYSMSKPVTAAAMLILRDEGKWRLDDPVTRFAPALGSLQVVDDKAGTHLAPMVRPPTLRELMSHTAGFAYGIYSDNPADRAFRQNEVLQAHGLEEMIERLSKVPLKFQPGTGWSYSVAADVEGAMVESMSGEPFGAFLAQRIFRPLGMDDTGFWVDSSRSARLATLYLKRGKAPDLLDASHTPGVASPDFTRPPALESGGGGLVSTTLDYGRFCQMLLNRGQWRGSRILSEASVELMETNAVPEPVLAERPASAGVRLDPALGFGLGVRVDRDPPAAGLPEGRGTISWQGAAGTFFWVDPANDILFIGMLQRAGDLGAPDPATIARALVYSALTHPER